MADPPGEGWSYFGETMSGLDSNFNGDRNMNESMNAFCDGMCFVVLISTLNAREIQHFLLR